MGGIWGDGVGGVSTDAGDSCELDSRLSSKPL